MNMDTYDKYNKGLRKNYRVFWWRLVESLLSTYGISAIFAIPVAVGWFSTNRYGRLFLVAVQFMIYWPLTFMFLRKYREKVHGITRYYWTNYTVFAITFLPGLLLQLYDIFLYDYLVEKFTETDVFYIEPLFTLLYMPFKALHFYHSEIPNSVSYLILVALTAALYFVTPFTVKKYAKK